MKTFSEWLKSRLDEITLAKSAVCLGVVPVPGGVALTIRDDQGQQGNTTRVLSIKPLGGAAQGSAEVKTQNSTWIVRMTPNQMRQAQMMMQQQQVA